MSLATLTLILSAVVAAFSGIFWILATRVSSPEPLAYLSSAPKWVKVDLKIQSLFNGAAAWLAAIAAFCQSISTAIQIHGG